MTPEEKVKKHSASAVVLGLFMRYLKETEQELTALTYIIKRMKHPQEKLGFLMTMSEAAHEQRELMDDCKELFEKVQREKVDGPLQQKMGDILKSAMEHPEQKKG